MLFTVTERANTREITTGRNQTYERTYVILGAPQAGDNALDLDAKALEALAAIVDATVTIAGIPFVLASHHVEPVNVWNVDASGLPAGTMIWDGSALYQRFDWQPKETGESTFSFDTSGGTQHITQSLSTVAKYPAGTAPDCKGAIGVSQSGDSQMVEGVDIVVPVYNWSETHYLSNATVTAAYKQTLFGLTGKVNTAAFKGFAIGEVLFLGASGSQRGTEDWEITFRFAASKNKVGLTIGTITGIDKKGWEYLWVRYKDSIDANVKVKVPAAVYTEQVYENGDFSGLGI